MKSRLTLIITLLILVGSCVFFFKNFNTTKATVLYEELNAEQFEEIIQKQGTATFFFGRATCQACREFNPILNEAIGKTNAQVYYLDCDQMTIRDIAKKFNVKETPTLLITENGKEIDKYIGLQKLDKTIEILSTKY
ncbi:thioredoxin family protein [Lysinibacillus agricola]|uniref:Thioredoxin family protein n=1 Tax=Lysinibacillus agricola TaxID=2590012 RepID=A0ABX7AQH4_9BACI|nr:MULTISPECIES: thioredoxin family protein [Lysinibacillus]KOS63228.1 hypothetical protein AN161_08390 [Lysinibacillus sp. FJAT-14222]QQP12203.1 thioredoxin family protein [Lysinibacillus agricola]